MRSFHGDEASTKIPLVFVQLPAVRLRPENECWTLEPPGGPRSRLTACTLDFALFRPRPYTRVPSYCDGRDVDAQVEAIGRDERRRRDPRLGESVRELGYLEMIRHQQRLI
jgi:hypothetical protein